MNKKIIKFVNNEKEISAYKLELLSAVSKKYKDRLILIEQEFLAYPFLELSIDSVEEMRNAVNLFRLDRHAFDTKYNQSKENKKNKVVTKKDLLIIRRKAEQIKNLSVFLVNKKLNDINLVDDKFLQKKFLKKAPPTSIEEAQQVEGAFCAKHRARVQIILFGLARVLFKESSSVLADLEDGNMSYCQYFSLNKKISSLMNSYNKDIFKYYNDSIIQLQEILVSGRGRNPFIGSIYPLKNICNLNEQALFFERVLDEDKNLLTESGQPIIKKYTKRAYSLDAGINRVGNENVDILYSEIYSKNGTCLDSIVHSSFYNLKKKDYYTKAISTIPLWEMDKVISDDTLRREVFELIGTEKVPLNDSIISKDKDIICRINNGSGKLYIDKTLSKIMVGATRTESEKIIEAKKHVDLLINSIIKEHKDTYLHYQNTSEKNSDVRKEKVKEIIRSIFNGK